MSSCSLHRASDDQNPSTNAQFRNYFAKQWFTPAALSEIDRLADVYPDSLLQGSPFDTGLFNVLSPQFKRMAALQGDAVFQAPRRFFMQQIADKQPTWGYLSKRNKKLPFLGSVSTRHAVGPDIAHISHRSTHPTF